MNDCGVHVHGHGRVIEYKISGEDHYAAILNMYFIGVGNHSIPHYVEIPIPITKGVYEELNKLILATGENRLEIEGLLEMSVKSSL